MSRREGYLYDDYTKVTVTIAEADYKIGADTYTLNTGAFKGSKNFIAEEVLLLATQDCYVRFNKTNAIQHYVHANVYYRHKRKVGKIYHQRVTSDGYLEIWSEGNIPNDCL